MSVKLFQWFDTLIPCVCCGVKCSWNRKKLGARHNLQVGDSTQWLVWNAGNLGGKRTRQTMVSRLIFEVIGTPRCEGSFERVLFPWLAMVVKWKVRVDQTQQTPSIDPHWATCPKVTYLKKIAPFSWIHHHSTQHAPCKRVSSDFFFFNTMNFYNNMFECRSCPQHNALIVIVIWPFTWTSRTLAKPFIFFFL